MVKKIRISKLIDIILEHNNNNIYLQDIYCEYKNLYNEEWNEKMHLKDSIRRTINSWRDTKTNKFNNPFIIEKYNNSYFINMELLEKNVDKFNLSSKSLKILNQNINSETCKLDLNEKLNVFYDKEKIKVTEKKLISSFQYTRESFLKNIVKSKYFKDGKCEFCKKTSFKKNINQWYVEVHHVDFLREGGKDKENNLICLCANCHREAHYAEEWKKDFLKKSFKEIINKRNFYNANG